MPKENHEVPPLDYALVHRLKRAHLDLEITINGGIASLDQAQEQLGFVDGVVCMAPVSSYTAGYGVRPARWLPRRKIEIAFGIFLAIASLRFLISLF